MYVLIFILIILIFFLIYHDNNNELFNNVKNKFINVGDKELRLINISNTISNLEIDSGVSCKDKNNCQGSDMYCLPRKEGLECVKKPSGSFYELDMENDSYMEILDLDSLNIDLKFNIIFRKLGENCIVRSGLNLWELGTKRIGNNMIFILNLGKSYNKFSIPVKVDNYYSIHIKTSKNNIICKIGDNNKHQRQTFNLMNSKDYDLHNIIFSLPKNTNKQDNLHAFIGNVKVISKELYQNPPSNSNSKCTFLAQNQHSANESDCQDKCIKWTNCNHNDCKQKCKDCSPNCYYENYGDGMFPKISVNHFSVDGKQALLTYKFNNPNNDILGFVCVLFKTHRKQDGVILNKISLSNCKQYCEYIIDSLEPNVSYTVGIKSYTKSETSKMSNQVVFTPIKVGVNTSIMSDVFISDYEVGNFKRHNCKK